MNKKISIPIGVGIIIIIAGIIVVNNQESNVMKVEDALDEEINSLEEITPEVQKKLDEIEKINLENEYSPKDREWITSGPFQLDRSEYILGEKIFLRIGGLSFDDKGQVAFLREVNSTHYSVYLTVPFDGSDKSAFNYYLEPQLSKTRGICTAEDLIGEWRAVFRNTDHPNLHFKITDEILPGEEEDYQQSVC